MTDLESINDPEPDPAAASAQARADAFSAAPFFWQDIQLAPMAIDREADWLSHCRRIGLPPLSAVINDADSFLAHAIRLIWFCAHDPSKWLARWMRGGDAAPMVLEIVIRQWLDKHIQPGDQASAALKLALAIYDRSRINQAALIDDDDEEDTEGNGSGPAHELSTSASSAGPAPAPSRSITSGIICHKSKAGPSSTRLAAPMAASTSGRKKARRKKRKSGRG